MSHSKISPETVAQIESWMDPLEISSCIFLLYDNVETALQTIFLEIQTCRSNQPVLDSVLYKGEVYHEGPISKWSRASSRNPVDSSWQGKLLEALLIMKDFWIIKNLSASRRDLEIKFLPNQVNTSCHIDLLRKVLYLMVEDLSKEDWNKLQQSIVVEKKLQSVPPAFTASPECFLLYLMSKNFIQIKRKDQRVELSLLTSCLKRMEQYYWSEQLKSIENLINREAGFTVANEVKNVPCRTTPSTRFLLDPENPGIILIFNAVDYDGKMINGTHHTKREGSLVDEKRLLETFDLLKFKSIVISNPKVSAEVICKIKHSLKQFCSEAKTSKQERCFAVAILAHGDKEGFYSTEGDLITWESVRDELRHPDTNGLARLLLIQACKGNSQVTRSEDVEKDGVGSESDSQKKNLKDIFELSSSPSGFAAYRSTLHGSFFLQSFCKNVLQFGNDCDLHQITTLINKDFDSKNVYSKGSDKPVSMTAELVVTPLKALYLGVPQTDKHKAEALVQLWEHIERNQCQPRNQQSPTAYLQQNLEDQKKMTALHQNDPQDIKDNGEEHEGEDVSFLSLKQLALAIGSNSGKSNKTSK